MFNTTGNDFINFLSICNNYKLEAKISDASLVIQLPSDDMTMVIINHFDSYTVCAIKGRVTRDMFRKSFAIHELTLLLFDKLIKEYFVDKASANELHSSIGDNNVRS